MRRRSVIGLVVLALIALLLVFVYTQYFRGEPAPPATEHADTGETLSTESEFDRLAREDPVKMLDQAVTRYQREAAGGAHFELTKQERVNGEPKPPAPPPVERIDTWVRGDVPDATGKTNIEIVMKWKDGAKEVLGSKVEATLFRERPDEKMITWRPTALRFLRLSPAVPPNNPMARSQSRYCIRDAGLYRSMLRTFEAWKERQTAGAFAFEYLGKKPIAELGGVECHVIKRVCRAPEVDAFELGGVPDPAKLATDGFTEVTIYVDAGRWLQLGTELHRTEPEGERVLVGAYYFRDVELNPKIPPDTFTFTADVLMKK